ncbi:COMM domain-containing protein 8-like isoform X2 [Watersipora subatra]|uniref:COMM domain-containing protein 8-like isoform X2 n=1 Tax=Watersipora subatra TaxID=2589382 RepID=UPI00355BA7D6
MESGATTSTGNDSKVIHSLVDRLVGVGLPAPNYSDYSDYWGLHEWIKHTDLCTEMILKCSGSNNVTEQVQRVFGDSVTARAFMEVLRVREGDIRRAVANAVCRQQSSYLKDFDWQLQLVLGSDKISSIEDPVVDVLLDLQQGETSRQVSIELTSNQLDTFVETLENINKEVMQKQL